jgi:tetratricopeptide (TPR) repeat protein
MGRYDEAVVLLKAYADGLNPAHNSGDSSRKAAALYWIGESLFSMGQLDRAHEIFTVITTEYPQSVKYEAASYRLSLINQKKVEGELLRLLQWSHEESLKTVEDYQRRERSYDQAIIAYQKRIADMLKDTRLADLETTNVEYLRQIDELKAALQIRTPQAVESPEDRMTRLLTLKARAQELREELSREFSGASGEESE